MAHGFDHLLLILSKPQIPVLAHHDGLIAHGAFLNAREAQQQVGDASLQVPMGPLSRHAIMLSLSMWRSLLTFHLINY